jgi:hypothetical protein
MSHFLLFAVFALWVTRKHAVGCVPPEACVKIRKISLPGFRSPQNLMSNQKDTDAVDFLFPLQKRTRSAAVTAQLAEMSRLSQSAVRRRAAETDPERRLERETLIALVRGYGRAGNKDAADTILVLLVQRVTSAVAAKVSRWAGMTPEDKTDAQRQMIVQICEQVSSLSQTAELWECNFTWCFNQRSITLWHRLTDRKVATVSAETQNSDGESRDRLEQQPDPADRFADIELRELVALVSGGSAKRSQAIFLRMSGFSEEEIAERLDVTSRTLRNWTTEARAVWKRQAQ